MKNLRELAKDYSHNTIDQETYRKSRSELIQGICTGEIKVDTREYLAPLDPVVEVLDDTTENMITQIAHPDKNRKPASDRPEPQKARPTNPPVESTTGIFHQKKFFISMSIVILICVVTLSILLIPTTKDDQSTATNFNVVESSSGQKLITGFIKQKNWSQDNMSSFVRSWHLLSVQERATTATSPEMKRLINSIYRQLLDERALLSLGDVDNAVANQQSLVNFAKQLGIDDKRLTVLEPETKPDTAKNIVAETSQTEIVNVVDTKDSNIDLNPAADSIPETVTNLEEDVSVEDINSQSITTEEPPETSPTSVTEPQNPVKESSAQETVTEQTIAKTTTQKSTNKAACVSSLAKSRKPFCRDKIEGVGNGPTMAVIRNGKFTMGGENKAEQPAHSVTISAPFAMSVHEISFGEYSEFCQSSNTSCPKQPWSGKDYPVVNISHDEAVAYTDWLSEKTGQAYRLPSEAEWEYAARAGTKTRYPFGDEILITNAVFSDRKNLSAPLPKTDRSINRNKFRLYHMVGNVREWVADTWHDGYSGAPENGSARIEPGVNQFVVRGGSYTDSAQALRSGAREKLSTADNTTGFRVLQELSE